MRLIPFAAFIVPCALSWPSWAQDSDADLELRQLYSELIAIETTLSAQRCTEAADMLAVRLRDGGLPESDIHVITAPDQPTKGSLVAVLRGSDPDAEALLLLAHIDVVEAKREDWERDPFTLIEENGYFYGRGVADDKAMSAIFVDALIRYQREGFVPRRDIKIALTCGEETPNDFNGVRYIVENHFDLVDAEFAINEGARGVLTPDGEPVYLGVQAGEKVYQDYRLEITNPGGHSSRPLPDNAIYRLAAALTRISEYGFPIEFIETTRQYFSRMAEVETGQAAADMRAILADTPDPEALDRVIQDPTHNAILRTTCVATMLDGGHAPNGLPQRAGANINCRILPGHTQEEVRQTLIGIVDDPGISVTLAADPEQVSPPPPLPVSFMQPIEEIAADMWPGVPVVPTMLTGATDGRFLTPAGIPTYGVSGMFSDPAMTNAHGLNERLPVASFYEGRDFLDRLIRAFTTAE